MPVMDGMEFLKAFTKVAPQVPVIIASGRGVIEDAIETLRMGAWDYITKPINSAELLHTVTKALERAHLLEENRRYHLHLEDEIKKRTSELRARTIELISTNKKLAEEVIVRKRAESELRQFNLNLEQMVEERTQQLKIANDELKNSLQKIEEDEEAGRKIQFQLLPEEQIQLGKYEFSRKLLPSMYLSGDFLDYFEIDKKHIGFYIADVSGHGVSSAIVTALLKSFVDQYLSKYNIEHDKTILNPAQTLQKLNRDLLNENLDKYLTIYFGIIDQEKNEITHCNAGHYPFPLLHTKGESTFLKMKGSPVGLFDSSVYENQVKSLPEEFTLLLVSDGILEIVKNDDFQKKQNFVASLIKNTDLTLQDVLHDLNLGEHMSLPDDVTLLMLKRRK
jgi:serine phosphatase RsbU (regulator of sigma subunit)